MKFTSNGKLLIAGEYLVLKGAKSFAVPVNFGQSILIQKENEEGILWESYADGDLWFSTWIKTKTFEIIETSDMEVSQRLVKILKAADQLSGGFIKKQNGIRIISNTDFNLSWGLGSSSTLISNIAWWAKVDPFELHFKVSDGSGYDIACARNEGPLFYSVNNKIPKAENVNFNPEFSKNICFVWLGKKRNSADEVSSFGRIRKGLNNEIDEISQLSTNIAYAPTLDDFEYYMKEHELVISTILKREPVKSKFFNDYPGEIKSLGGWGGDFIMATSDRPFSNVQAYFSKKGLNTTIPFKDMVRIW